MSDKLKAFVTFFVFLLVCQSVFADLAQIPNLSARVTDLTQTLSAQQTEALEAKLKALETEKGSQIAVLIVPTTQPEDIAQYSIRVVEKWQLGREKADDGVLILLAKNDRKMRIEVGYGLEGAIPDLTAKRIINEIIAPKFKQGDFDGGLNAGVDTLIKIISGEALPAPKSNQNQTLSGSDALTSLLLMTLVLATFLPQFFGRFLGSAGTGGIIGSAAVSTLASTPIGIAFGVGAFAFALMLPWLFGGGATQRGGYYGRGYGGGWGGYSGGGSSGWAGGGGDFGGGGASGDW